MFRVVVYAEGQGELAGSMRHDHAPGSPLSEQELGPAHLLVRRCLESARELDPSVVRFEEPLRTGRGRRPRGSDLHNGDALRRLLLWADESKQPDLAVVFVDADGDEKRQGYLDTSVQGIPVDAVVGVAIEEFEAWLIADAEALKSVFRQPLAPPKSPERLGRRRAKELLQQWCEQHGRSRDAGDIRGQLALLSDLETLSRQCGAFATFLQKLRAPSG